jgi:ubiquinone/menaquinone biosynthesis C-methylase UbiE
MLVELVAGYRALAPQYDADSNPLVHLEKRVLLERLARLEATTAIDVATGTGRWMSTLQSKGVRCFGLDLSRDMLAEARRKPGLATRLIAADMRCLPFRSGVADLAICSFAIGYLPSLDELFRELSRVAERVIVSDLHPDAAMSGWKRSFRRGDTSYTFEQYVHFSSELQHEASAAGLKHEWTMEPRFGEPERRVFESAGKGEIFDAMTSVPAVLITSWTGQ